MGKECCVDIFPKKKYKWPISTWKMLDISHQENENRNYSDGCSPRWGALRSHTGAGEDMRNPRHGSWEVKC